MEKLFLDTPEGNIPIDPTFIEKYNLQKGMRSPFTNDRIVGENGEYFIDPTKAECVRERRKRRLSFDGFRDDGIDDMNHGAELSTSEIIDFSQGTDSD
ncbi:MAG TPA: hypothetical protein VFC96_07155 [Anaerovoracaceae bacterium]|nr:hypothetical protein [Anaerovoracaceae bacterium]